MSRQEALKLTEENGSANDFKNDRSKTGIYGVGHVDVGNHGSDMADMQCICSGPL